MQKIKAAFFDIDGTLLSFATRRVPASTAQALKGMRAAGLRLFIASGRPPMYLVPLREELDFRFDGYVLTNGQCCTDADGVPFYNQPLPAASAPALLRWLDAHPEMVCTFCEADYVYDNRHSEAVDARCQAAGVSPKRASIRAIPSVLPPSAGMMSAKTSFQRTARNPGTAAAKAASRSGGI